MRKFSRMLLTAHRPFSGIKVLANLQCDITLIQDLAWKLAGQEGLDLLGQDGGTHLLRLHHGNAHEVFRELYRRWM